MYSTCKVELKVNTLQVNIRPPIVGVTICVTTEPLPVHA